MGPPLYESSTYAVWCRTRVRGKFYRPGATFHLPVYLDDQLQARLSALATAKGVELTALVNELLKKDLERIEGTT